MRMTEFYGFRLTPADLGALRSLAAREERTLADIVRRLIREAAYERGLMPLNGDRQLQPAGDEPQPERVPA